MKRRKLSKLTRILLVVCGLALIAVLVLPVWRIDLNAPQYPEGLRLLIYAGSLGGNVDIINGLNHYIGMKTLHTQDFIEFSVLPIVIVFFVVAFILTALIGSRKLVYWLFALFVGFGIVAIADFWRWEYNYGHNLNPDAAIIVPGMAYQPPLIGFKQLLNFGAYSMPDAGGWIFLAAGIILLAIVVFEWRSQRHPTMNKPLIAVTCLLLSLPWLNGCTTAAEPLRIGIDACAYCKMTISDKRYGAELITKKGKIYKFDDPHCLQSFLESRMVDKKEIGEFYLTDFTGNHSLISQKSALLLQGDCFKGPMNGNIAAFSNRDSMQKMIQDYKAAAITWNQFQP